MKIRGSRIAPYLLTIFIACLAIVSRAIQNGAVYGLDFSLFQPDGVRYHALTLHLLGNSWSEVSAQISQFYKENALHWNRALDPIDGTSSAVATAWSRPLYSILSVPFVFLFGQWGMLAIPALSILGIGFLLVAMARQVSSPWVGVALFVLLTATPTFMRWAFLNYTDALALLILFALVLVLYRDGNLWFVSILVVLALLARPVGPVLIALLVVKAWRSNGTRRLVLTFLMAISFVVTLSLLILRPDLAEFARKGEESQGLVGQLVSLPENLVKVPVVEFGQLFVMDRFFFILTLLMLFVALRQWRDDLGATVILTFLVVMFLGIWMGALGANFRLQLPLLAPGALLLIRYVGTLRLIRRA